jgi:two-component system, repressor protein LuxO
MQKVYQTISNVAKSDVTVFITGETGTGKELGAEAIHQESQRKDKPFKAINCAALPHDLLETELFGYVKGAFTGADKKKPGVACVADKGTLFLDEIGEMDLDLQSKLLRFVETGSFYQVGSHELTTVDIRFIAATNRDPYALVKAGKFREDLYYRLNAISICLPPLRERREDVLLIAQQFLKKYVIKAQKNFKGFAPEAEKVLLTYGWPGNVRQLLNVIRNIVLLNQGEIITPDMVLKALKEQPPSPKDTTPPQSAEQAEEQPPLISVAITSGNSIRPFYEIKTDVFTKVLKYRGDNVVQAAEDLGIAHSTIYQCLRKSNVPTKRQKKFS